MAKRIFMCSMSCFILFFSLLSPSHSYTPGSVEITVKDFYTEGSLSGAEVSMEPGGYSDTTDINGVVSFTGIIPYRNYAVSVSLDGYVEGAHGEGRTGFVWVRTGETTSVTVPLKKQSVIQGQVTSGMLSVPDAVVILTRTPLTPGEEDEEFVAGVRADGGGNYIFPSMSEGDYFIRAFAESYVVSSKDQITVGADETFTKDISLTPGYNFFSHIMLLIGEITMERLLALVLNLPGSQYNERYLVVTDAPPGAELLDISNNGFLFTPTLGGNYTVVSVVLLISTMWSQKIP